MRKKFITQFLTFALASSMILAGCGNTETNSGGDKTETETEVPADDQQAEAEESEEVMNEENAIEESDGGSAESETHEPYTADDVTDEMMQELYASIKDSVTTEYLEPNNINPGDFVWPDADARDWIYVYDELFKTYSISVSMGDAEYKFVDSSIHTASPNKEILDSAFIGIINFFKSHEPYDTEFYSAIYDKLNNDHTLIITNVTFE